MRDEGTYYILEIKDFRGNPRKLRVNRHLCIGGPYDKLWRSGRELADAREYGYTAYNRSSGRRNSHSMVYIYKDIVP